MFRTPGLRASASVALAFLATVGSLAACDRPDPASTTMTTAATSTAATGNDARDSGVTADPGTTGSRNGSFAVSPRAENAAPARNAVPFQQDEAANAGATSPTAPMPRAAAPNAPPSGYGNAGAVTNGTSAGSMNGTRPMNEHGSSSTPGSPSNGATDAPGQAAAPNRAP